MPTYTYNPTANSTPDAGQGGLAVTGNINTGHGSTVTSSPSGTVTRSCIWTTFIASGGQIASITLKFDWTVTGALNIGTGFANNEFRVQYSVNGGGAFTTGFQRNDVVAPDSGSASVAITLPLDITQFQVRDRMTATASADPSDNASITTSISNIRLEVVTVEGGIVVMM